MNKTRASGILLHPTSLPGKHGIGSMGKSAFKFVDWLEESNQTLWQILPLGPTGYGDSPYASFSTFAGNPLLIDLDILVDDGVLIAKDCITPDYITTQGSIDFGAVTFWKTPLLYKAATNFLSQKKSKKFQDFCSEHQWWLEDYATFMSIKVEYDIKAREENVDGKFWNNYWPKDLAARNKKALKKWKETHSQNILLEKIIQFFFFSQWMKLKSYANAKGIKIIGDIPIFVALDSADVWSNQKFFQLKADGTPKFVAGVPPDYFSKTGQLWGNPLYDWKVLRKSKYNWWKKRISATLSMVDIVRIDHFRGFESYWAVPAGDKTAEKGSWIPGPGHHFFTALGKSLGEIPLLAEDLGVITPEVGKLRDDFNYPGMKVLQFAFGDNTPETEPLTNAFLPHLYTNRCIVYTGTHDNTTLRDWLNELAPHELSLVHEYLGGNCPDELLVNELIRLAYMSVADYAVFPLQDIFSIGSEGRMNTPSTLGGNWAWRMSEEHLCSKKAEWLKKLSRLYARNYPDK